jgi:hypothetical protein
VFPAPQPTSTVNPKRLVWVAALLYLFSLLMIAGGIVFAPPGQPTRWFDEKQTMTSYSATLLYTCLLVSVLNFLAARDFASPQANRRLKGFWALGAAGFFVLMLDEFFVMHEGLGGLITYRILGLVHSPMHDRFDGFIVASYGVCALAILAFYRREWRRIEGFTVFLAAGAAFGIVSIFMDLSDAGVWGIYLEEGTKILANTSFLLACMTAALANYRHLRFALRADSARPPESPSRNLQNDDVSGQPPGPGRQTASARRRFSAV